MFKLVARILKFFAALSSMLRCFTIIILMIQQNYFQICI